LEDCPEIPATYENVVSTQLATTLGSGKATVSTVEHMLAAFHGMGVDNAIVEVDGPEVPIVDGSAVPFCEKILEVGVEAQLRAKSYLALRRRIEFNIGEKWAIAEPCSRFEITASIKWNHPSIGYQEFHYVEGKTKFVEVAGARTFGFLKDVEALRKIGLARGGSLDNAIVLDGHQVLNADGLRFEDEFVRHKLLDAIGDMKLARYPILGHIRLHRAGHDLHQQLLAEIFKDSANYEIIDVASRRHRQIPHQAVALAQAKLAATY
jgi:UDP-3-O-[3-hydroxymyristoyl] N-acetylglucosamine deacetylase